MGFRVIFGLIRGHWLKLFNGGIVLLVVAICCTVRERSQEERKKERVGELCVCACMHLYV